MGWSKLSKIEDLVTPETAGWFARFVQEAPKSEVDLLLEVSTASPFPATSGPGGAPCDGTGSSPSGQDQPAPAAAEGVASPGWADLGEDFRPTGPKRTSLELSPFCRELAVRLQAEYRLRGVSVSLGELVELAFRVVWASGRFPLPDEAPAAVDPPAEIAATVAARPTHNEAPAAFDPPAEIAANGHPEGECGSVGSKPEPEPAPQPEDVAGIGPCGSGAIPRSLPLSQHKVLAVVISVAETGQNWMRTLGGVIPVRLADLSGLAPVVEIVTLAEVNRRLEIKAAESRGKGILTDTRLFVAATSGLHCQARDCDQPVAHVHHGKPKAEGLDHGPANTYGICERCHAARHGGLVLNPDAHPGDWVFVDPSQRPDPNRVDRACQALRQQALAAGFRVA